MTAKQSNESLIKHLEKEGVSDQRVLQAMRCHPRALFLSEGQQHMAYKNHPLRIGCNQTISQPYIVALMTEILINAPEKRRRVLEIGTGSGYQAAILSDFYSTVYTLERIHALYKKAKQRFANQGLDNIQCFHSDGHQGWPLAAPYDGIIVTCLAQGAPPPALLEQLSEKGRLVIPVQYEKEDMLCVIERQGQGFSHTRVSPVRFVPFLKGLS